MIIIIASVALILVIIAGVIWCYGKPKLTTSYKFYASNDILSLPLFYDRNGVFITDVIIGSQSMSVVIDTGSSHLVLSSYKCSRCIEDQNSYVRKENMPADTSIIRASDTISYGSQSDQVDWYLDSIRFPSSYESGMACSERSGVYKANVAFGLVTSRTGNSNYSIMGIGFTDDPGYDRQEIQFMHHIARKTIQFAVKNHEGALVIGSNVPRNKSQFLFPMRHKNLFYGVKIYDIILNESISCRSKYPNTIPDMIIFDTGSNMMDMPQPLFDLFEQQCLNNTPFGSISFVIQDVNGEFMRINLDSSVYLWKPKEVKSCIIEPSTHYLECIIWGSLFMNNFEFWFDIDLQKIGILKTAS